MRTFLIHTDMIGGHQIEYVHHLYMGAVSCPEDAFFFVMPKRFEMDSSRFIWPKLKNVKIVILKEGEEAPYNCGLLKKGLINSRVIRFYSKAFHATDVISISIMTYLPFLPLFINRNVRFSGIIYRTYLYEWKEESIKMKVQDALKYWIMSHFRVFHRVYMCNDSASANYINRLFKTEKYKYLPDPVASPINYDGHDIREELGIPSTNVVLLHPGGMDTYKNTLGILRSLLMLKSDKTEKLTVILAGRVVPSIRKEFEQLYKLAEEKMQIIFQEGYLPFERLADLFVSSDYVLVPYSVKSQSSGIVGHAAFYGKPVVAVQGGIIGKMVRKWHLGHLLYRSSDVSIYQFLSSIDNKPLYSTRGNTYLDSHSVEMFYRTILFDN